ncbi:MAG: hypothetical protein F6K28_43105 [Microcoleus sp. SIO2G3]|nr:hypothetical protein [Microcoleus sp. SIO2G3]
MSGVVKIDILEPEETLKALLLKAEKVEEREKPSPLLTQVRLLSRIVEVMPEEVRQEL